MTFEILRSYLAISLISSTLLKAMIQIRFMCSMRVGLFAVGYFGQPRQLQYSQYLQLSYNMQLISKDIHFYINTKLT